MTESAEFSNNDGDTVYHPLVREVQYHDGSTYSENRLCAVDFEAPSDNKGFEGLQLVNVDGEKFFVGLCEGNHCAKGDKGRDAGNGRVVVFGFGQKEIDDEQYQYLMDVGIGCLYSTMQTVDLPKEIEFEDYAALQFRPRDGESANFDVVIGSQESAAIWVGTAEWTQSEGLKFGNGTIYQFPKTGNCETQFCNVEGVAMLNDDELVMVSDKAKKGGKQPWICGAKDQSIHIFKVQ